jgi:hypothetical protein
VSLLFREIVKSTKNSSPHVTRNHILSYGESQCTLSSAGVIPSSRYPRKVPCLDLLRQSSFSRAIERRFVEVRRRTRPMGTFSDRTSMERILFSVFTYENLKQRIATPFLLLTQNMLTQNNWQDRIQIF